MSGWDTLVVGAGPAGSATAARLAQAGQRVLLLDRAAFPRRKPCGECVNPAGVAALHRLGAWERVAALDPQPLAGWTITAPGGAHFTGSFPDDSPGVAVPRAELDLALLHHAAARGAQVRTGARVVDLVVQGERVVGVRTAGGEVIRCDTLVGADGLRSVVARRLRLKRRPPRLRKIALTAHLAGVDWIQTGRGELRTFAGGCVGIARVAPGVANVTVVLSGDAGAGVAGDAAACFDRTLRECGIRGERVDEVLASGPFDCPMRAVVSRGALLVGDAAGYYDPFTGQGIYRALRGAELAAAALLAGDGLAGYARAHRAAFAPGERLQHLVEAFVSRPRWLGWAAGRLARSPQLGDALVQATGDVVSPRSLLRPSLIARLAI